MQTQEQILNMKSLAKYLGVSQTTIRRAIKSGKLPAIQLNDRGCYIFLKSQIDEQLKSLSK